MPVKKVIIRSFIWIGLSLFAIMILVPLIWMVLTGLKTNKELFLAPWMLPETLKFDNYSKAWTAGIGMYFKNSVIVTVMATAGSTLLSCFAAYPLSRYTFRSKRFWILVILGGLMLAPQSSLISLFKMTKWFGVYDTHLGLIIINGAFRIPFSTFLLMTYYKSISYSLDESAYIDGASTWTIFWRIIMPLSKPIIASVIIICFRSVWNELMFANVLLQTNDLKTIPVGLLNLQGYTTTNWTMLVAGMVITSIPLILFFHNIAKAIYKGINSRKRKGIREYNFERRLHRNEYRKIAQGNY